jgi:hypothetical protein
VITLCTVSSVVAFALERTNVDLLVFLQAMLAVALTRRNWPLRAAGYGVALLAGMLKFYPVTLLILAVRERLEVFVAVGIAALGVLAIWFALDGTEILRGMANIPTTSYFDDNVFGMRNLPFGLAQIFDLPQPAAVALLIALLIAMLASALVLARQDVLRSRVRSLTDAEATFLLVGGVLLVSCFLAAQNGLYRAIHFLFVLPGLTAMARIGGGRGFDGVLLGTVALITALMWNSSIRMLIYAAVAKLGVSIRPDSMAHFNVWLVRELVWWLVVTLLSGMVLRLVWESRVARDAGARWLVIRQASHSG